MNCKDCGSKMLALFSSYVCEPCDERKKNGGYERRVQPVKSGMDMFVEDITRLLNTRPRVTHVKGTVVTPTQPLDLDEEIKAGTAKLEAAEALDVYPDLTTIPEELGSGEPLNMSDDEFFAWIYGGSK